MGFSSYENCQQCPRECGVNRFNAAGVCGEGEQVRIALACLHFGEEPPVTVHGGSGTIFFTGCTLRCAFCQNYQISQNGMGKAVSSAEFTEICLRLQTAGAENINLVTGSHAIPRIAEYIADAVAAGVTVPFCWNSSAFEKPELLELLKPYVKIWLPDLKTLSSSLSGTLFAAAQYPDAAKSAIKWMIQNFPLKMQTVRAAAEYTDAEGERIPKGFPKEKMTQGVIIRHLFLPGHFDATAETLAWLKENADRKAFISLMNQYTPVPFEERRDACADRQKRLGVLQNRLVTPQEDRDLRDLIDAYDFDYLFYQELSDDSSWLPDFNRPQPFSNKLAKPIWHWKNGFCGV